MSINGGYSMPKILNMMHIHKWRSIILLCIAAFISYSWGNPLGPATPSTSQKRIVQPLSSGFVHLTDVAPTIQQDVRYAGTYNFVGRPVKGYHTATIILTQQAAYALAKVQAALQKMSHGKWTLRVYDGYRPQSAVDDFWNWAQDIHDTVTKSAFYPNIASKQLLFSKGYIAKRSGHSRGSTVDLTIATTRQQPPHITPKGWIKDNSIEMGCPFDLFDVLAHGNHQDISEQAKKNRKLLQALMVEHGFTPYKKEWWHFTLRNEPFPNTYFDFPVQ